MLGLFLGVCGLAGCAAGTDNPAAGRPAPQTKEAMSRKSEAAAEQRADEFVVAQMADGAERGQPAQDPAPNKDKGADKKGAAGQPNEPFKRKIIFTGGANLSVEDFDQALRELKALAKNLGGYISNSSDSGKSGGQRRGTYTVRVPVDQFATFMDDVAKIGELHDSETNAQDVTDQYIDVDAQMKSDKQIEEGLLKLHDEIAKKGVSEELFRVEDRLRAVRAQILASERRLQRWDKDAAMSTVVVKLEQRTEYAPAGSPDFGTTVSRTWDGSLGALAAFGKGALIVAVALAPWLVVLGAVTSPLWFLLWRQLRKPRPAKPAPTPANLPAVVEPA
jgi:hypothetical protein